MKVSIIKASADGEQINFEVVVPSEVYKRSVAGEDVPLDAFLRPAFHVADKRLMEMNQRVAAAKYVMDHFPAEIRMRVNQVLEIIHGNVPTHAIQGLVQQAREDQAKAQAGQTGPTTEPKDNVIEFPTPSGVEITP